MNEEILKRIESKLDLLLKTAEYKKTKSPKIIETSQRNYSQNLILNAMEGNEIYSIYEIYKKIKDSPTLNSPLSSASVGKTLFRLKVKGLVRLAGAAGLYQKVKAE